MGTIRFLLAFAVVSAHIPAPTFYFFHSHLAVISFFVISGFYMSLILNEKYHSYRSFLINRLLRLFPVYWVVLFITFVFVLFHHNFVYSAYWELLSIPSFILVVLTNLFIIGQDIVMFMGVNLANGSIYLTSINLDNVDFPLYHYLLIGPAWSISLELMFYMAAPFLVKKKAWLIILIILLSASFRFYMGKLGFINDPWSYRFFPFEITFFCWGILSYKVYARIKRSAKSGSTAWTLFFLMILYTIGYQYVPGPYSKLAFNLYPLCLAASIPFIFLQFKSNPWDRYIGDLSYPIYICHTLVVAFMVMFLYPYLPVSWHKISWVGITVIVVLFSMALLKFISDPIDRYRHSKVI